MSYYSSDFYNYIYTKFLWDYDLFTDELEPNKDFDKIYIVLFNKKSCIKQIFNSYYKSDDKLLTSEIFISSSDLVYYVAVDTKNIENLKRKFIDAYTDHKYNDLHNFIYNFYF